MRSVGFLFCAVLLVPAATRAAPAPNPLAELNRLVAKLQESPDDQALRERIIKLALKIKPKPAVPEDAERHMVRGAAAMKETASASAYQDAVAEFEKATLAAPWLASAYYNLGVVSNKAGDYGGAASALRLYLLAAPNAKDAKQVKALVYEIEFKQEKLGKEEAAKADAEALLSQLRRDVEGFSYICRECNRVNLDRAVKSAGEAGYQVEGCNSDEFDGKNWYLILTLRRDAKFDFPGDGTVHLVQATSGTPIITLIGTLKGRTLADIGWACPKSRYEDGRMVLTGEAGPGWVELERTGGEIHYSCDRPNIPRDDSGFNPAARYTYTWCKRQ